MTNRPNAEDLRNEREARKARRKERGKTPEQLGYTTYKAGG